MADGDVASTRDATADVAQLARANKVVGSNPTIGPYDLTMLLWKPAKQKSIT